MSKTFLVALLSGLLTVLSSASLAGALPTGVYYLKGGDGDLTVKQISPQASRFNIEAVGGNAHMCSLEGVVTDGTATLQSSFNAKDGTPCVVSFAMGADGIVVTSNGNACREYCGMRAMFEGLYLKPRPGCAGLERQKLNQAFIKQYRGKNYEKAASILKDMLGNCVEIMGWLDRDQTRNDYAVTLYHLGRKEECLSVLKQTWAYGVRDEDALRDTMAPTDFENYLPIAKATWHNIGLCTK